MLVVKCGNQEASINFEKLQNSNAKACLWSTLDMSLQMRVEEHIYKLERDETAML